MKNSMRASHWTGLLRCAACWKEELLRGIIFVGNRGFVATNNGLADRRSTTKGQGYERSKVDNGPAGVAYCMTNKPILAGEKYVMWDAERRDLTWP